MAKIGPTNKSNRAIAASVPKASSGTEEFRKDKGGTVKRLKDSICAEMRTDVSFKEYRATGFLKVMGEAGRKELFNYILENYDIELKIPEGKLALAEAKDELVDEVENISPENLLVLLYSIKRLKTEGNRSKSDLGGNFNEKYVVHKDSNTVTFKINCILQDSAANRKKLKDIRDMIEKLDIFIPQKPLTKVSINYATDLGAYDDNEHRLIIAPAVFSEDLMSYIVAHEMGHAIFSVIMAGEKPDTWKADDENWNKLYLMTLKDKNYKVVDDSNFAFGTDAAGHPFSNPDELFASSVAAFVVFSDSFSRGLSDSDTPEDMKKLGKMIYCYLRDNIFKGIFKDGRFIPKGTPEWEQLDAFKGIEWPMFVNEITSVTEEQEMELMLKALNGNDVLARIGAVNAAGWKGLKDERFIQPLIDAAKSRWEDIREEAARSIGRLGMKDRRFVAPLTKLLKDENGSVRFAAITALGKLGLRDERFIEPLIASLKMSYKSRNYDNGQEWVDKEPFLDGTFLRGIRTIEALNMKDVRLTQFLLWIISKDSIHSPYGNEFDRTFAEAAKALKVTWADGIEYEGVLEPLFLVVNGPVNDYGKESWKTIKYLARNDWWFVYLMSKSYNFDSRHYMQYVIDGLRKLDKEYDHVLAGTDSSNYLKGGLFVLLKDKRFTGQVAKALKAKEKYVRDVAYKVVAMRNDKVFVPALKEALKDPDLEIRKQAAESLMQFGIEGQKAR